MIAGSSQYIAGGSLGTLSPNFRSQPVKYYNPKNLRRSTRIFLRSAAYIAAESQQPNPEFFRL